MAFGSEFYVFLSIQAQDFIEDAGGVRVETHIGKFLSIQAQDFIEEASIRRLLSPTPRRIPEHSSSGLH